MLGQSTLTFVRSPYRTHLAKHDQSDEKQGGEGAGVLHGPVHYGVPAVPRDDSEHLVARIILDRGGHTVRVKSNWGSHYHT